MAENTVLEVQELTREFTRRGKPFAAVDHVDFRLGQGEFVAIVGRSGNGKSTLLNLITGLLKPTSGSIDLDGNDVTRLNDKQMSVVRNRIVGFVTQSQTLLPNLTALDNVILPSVLCNGKTAQRDVEIPADSSDAKSTHLPNRRLTTDFRTSSRRLRYRKHTTIPFRTMPWNVRTHCCADCRSTIWRNATRKSFPAAK